MKILHVLPSARAEGTPRLVLDWLTVKNVSQELLFLSEIGELKGMFDSQGVWTCYNQSFEPNFRNSLKIVWLVQKTCKNRKPDLVIAWPMGFSHWISLGARMAGIKRNIAHAGNPVSDGFLNKYIHTIVSTTLGKLAGNKVIACSNYVRESFVAVPLVSKKQVYAVYNCTQVEKYILPESIEKKTTSKRKFLMVATLEPHKDHKTLLKAWAKVEAIYQDVELKIAGDGSLKPKLLELKSNLGLKSVVFLGSITNVPNLLWESDVFILSTTDQEGFGTVLIEALAAGCSIIASDVPACREVLDNGRFGELIPKNDPSALTDKIISFIEGKIDEPNIEKQVEYASKFSPDNMVKKYVQIAGLNL